MLKIILLVSACLVLTNVAESKPTSVQQLPCVNCESGPVQARPKRHVDFILQSVGGMVKNILHEVFVHAERRRNFQQYNSVNNIGNGHHNNNYITYYNSYPNYK